MSEIVTMPKLGFDMAEGTLVRWVLHEGEKVEKGAVLAEIETDKATVEVESNYTGTIAKQLVDEGAIVPINTPIAIVAEPGEDVEQAAKQVPVEAAEKSEEPEEIPQEIEGPGKSKEAIEIKEISEGAHLPGGLKASPLARRMAGEMRINLADVVGSGPGGRITKNDVTAYLEAPTRAAEKEQPTPAVPAAQVVEPTAKPGKPLPPLAPLPSAETPGDEYVPLKRLRAAIGRRMTEAKQQVPHFYVTHEYDVDTLLELRKQLNAMLPQDQKISVNDFIIKAVAVTLRQFPNLNASLQGDQVLRYGSINIGVAVAVEGGLLTVVCRNADRKPLREIAFEVRRMVGRARDGKVRPEEIEGSTFSISNMGMYDVENFAAIINPPEAGILAIGSAREIAIVHEGQISTGWRMKATISVDHRVSDGAEAALFLQALAPYLEQPLRLML
jgi:pyruvate dehydrogenase E2 component (dihydrolipoamide acetyltransferase)